MRCCSIVSSAGGHAELCQLHESSTIKQQYPDDHFLGRLVYHHQRLVCGMHPRGASWEAGLRGQGARA